MTLREKLLSVILLTMTICWGSALVILSKRLHKAEVCNKVFVLYFKHNFGMNLNLDKIYEDGVKWVDDPQYQ